MAGADGEPGSAATPPPDAAATSAPAAAAPAAAAPAEGSPRSAHRLSLRKSFRSLSAARTRSKPSHSHPPDKNEPSRFLGEGVSFKAKLIGILEVNEARGDRMCQEALADLKMAIRAAGEHKQRININIAIDGLRLRDEKTGDCLYHHPVHKISFIAQDMSDSRAFGYIFGSPDTGHRFFGIKTDKAASQVVIAMRDLFQVVFELKKKEIELAKQHIEQHQIKLGGGLFSEGATGSKNGASSLEPGASKMRTIQEDSAVKENGTATSSKSAQQTSEVIADLLDLEFELNSIQQGIHQMERITPSDPFGPSSVREDPFGSDPFGDSFAPATTAPAPKSSRQPIVTLPPPPSAKEPVRSLADPFNVPATSRGTTRRSTSRATTSEQLPVAPAPSAVKPVQTQAPAPQPEKHWFDQETESLFDEGELVTPPLTSSVNTVTLPTVPPLSEQDDKESRRSPTAQKAEKPFDVFTELDPLGTGRSKPYVDRKDFFQELKNPPKKVLKDLVTEVPSEATAPLFQATFEKESNALTPGDGDLPCSTSAVLSSGDKTTVTFSPLTTSALSTVSPKKPLVLDVDPFEDTDPFDKTDPFAEDDFPQNSTFPSLGSSSDPFDTGFADFTMFGKPKKNDVFAGIAVPLPAQDDVKPSALISSSESSTTQTFHGPLRVSLPPEKTDVNAVLTTQPVTLPSSSTAPPSVLESPVDTLSKSKSKTSRLSKQTTLSTMVKLPSPKSATRSSSRLIKQITVDSCTTSSTSQPLRLSPTPPMPPTPSKSDRKSPVSQGILEGVTLRNRCAVTPSPPVVASFPDSGDGDSTSRLSGSSAELAEIAPEPPPRPAASIAAIKPPPLPPKRQQISCMMKPPPRPPHVDEPPHYDYIENYETSTSPTPQEIDVLQSPPLPVPARRPKFPEVDFVPQRPRRTQPPQPLSAKSSIGSDDYLTPTPFPLLPPPQKKSPSTDSGKFHHLAKARSPVMTTIDSILMSTSSATTTASGSDDRKKKPSTSLNITLSQLTKTGLQDLAAALGVSPGHLSNMTLQELTNCLSKLSTEGQGPDNGGEETKTETDAIKRDKYATLRESVDDEPEFKADFETNFEPPDSSDKLEDVFQEAPFDKYAVFRELIEEAKDDGRIKGSTDSEDAEPKQRTVVPETSEEEMKARKEAEDKYAALREITLDEGAGEKEDGDTSSEKDDSIAEGTKQEEEDDLLALSRQQSESTESPTVEAVTLREPQSIIETTILEEDATALEDDAGAGAEEIKQTPPLSAEISPVTKNADEQEAAESGDGNNESSVSEKEDPTNDIGSPDKDEDRAEGVSSAEGWAKFDSIVPEKTSPDTQREEVSSPWSSDGKETGRIPPPGYQDHLEREQEMERRRRMRARGQWRDDDDEEEGWEDRRADGMPWPERPWRENGWSDGEPYYDDGIHHKERIYHEERAARRRRPAPRKSGHRSSRDPSPWEQEDKDSEDHGWVAVNKRWRDRSVDEDEEEEEEEYEISRKPRSKPYPGPRDDERWRRYELREMNGLEYEEGRKRRPSPWRGEGESRGSWESGSWDEEERFSQREYCDRRSKEREEAYWRRREHEHDGRPYPWSRKCIPPDEDYMRPEQTMRWKGERYHRYSRERSRELPWEDDYSEQGDEESPRYMGRKQNWPKRPSSATESRWAPEKAPVSDYVPRTGEKQQHSLPSASRSDRPDSIEKMGSYTMSERRHREKVGRRPRSREGYFNSDQEYDYWPQERPRRQDKEISYDQRSQTLHTRRPQRYKKSEYSYSQKSPFDDDFTMQPFEVGIDTSKSQGAESDASDSAKQRSPALSSHSLPITGGSSSETFTKGKESHPSDPNSRPKEIGLSSPPEPYQSSLGEDTSRVRTPRNSTHRKSPFEDDFTPTEIRGIRLASSVSSDISDHRKSPYEDPKSCSRGPSVVDEAASGSVLDHKNGKLSDDVFLPAGAPETGKTHSEHAFADFESMPFGDSEFIPSPKTLTDSKSSDKKAPGTVWSTEDSNKHDKFHPGMKLRMSNLMRVDSSTSLKKSESINIFVRESDPFDDDFFCSDTGSTIPRPRSENTGRADDKSGASNQTEVFNWTQAFDSFNFEEEK